MLSSEEAKSTSVEKNCQVMLAALHDRHSALQTLSNRDNLRIGLTLVDSTIESSVEANVRAQTLASLSALCDDVLFVSDLIELS